jgi:hypothetical protein
MSQYYPTVTFGKYVGDIITTIPGKEFRFNYAQYEPSIAG